MISTMMTPSGFGATISVQKILLLLPFLLLGTSMADIGSPLDPSSYANVDEFEPFHIDLDFDVDFDSQTCFGSITNSLRVISPNVSTIYLDVWDAVLVHGVGVSLDGASNSTFEQVDFEISTPNPNIGNALAIELPGNVPVNSTILVKLDFTTMANTTALSWMTPDQTHGKEHPFMYSLFQMNFGRDFAPMMDSPSQKITYTASVVTLSNLTARMSANVTGITPVNDTHTLTTFDCSIKVPSYLIAIVVGNLEEKFLSDRVSVMGEPEIIDAAVEEFGALQEYLDVTEEYLTPYVWGNYSIVIMTPNFPWGGMEHTLITFVSPALIAGDKSMVDVAIHELTHSWFGNNIGCQNWDNFWVNEGMNTYMERKVTEIIHGKEAAMIEYYNGNSSVYFDDMLYYGIDDSYSSLYPNISDADPEDSFSGVPYEKGSQFMYYIETLLGEEMMQKMLREYINTFQQQAINQDDVYSFYEKFVQDNFNETEAEQIIIDTMWDTWIFEPGLAPVELNFETEALQDARDLAREYLELDGAESPALFERFEDFSPAQKVAFIQALESSKEYEVDTELLEFIDNDYNLTGILNPMVKLEWYTLGIKQGYRPVMDPAKKWIGDQGRYAYVRPIFQALSDAKNCEMAQEWFDEYESFYNSYVSGAVSRTLETCGEEESDVDEAGATSNGEGVQAENGESDETAENGGASSAVAMALPIISTLVSVLATVLMV